MRRVCTPVMRKRLAALSPSSSNRSSLNFLSSRLLTTPEGKSSTRGPDGIPDWADQSDGPPKEDYETGAMKAMKKWVKVNVRQPSVEGDRLMIADTPCLIIDLPRLEVNLARMNHIVGYARTQSGDAGSMTPFDTEPDKLGQRLYIRPNGTCHKSASVTAVQSRAHGALSGTALLLHDWYTNADEFKKVDFSQMPLTGFEHLMKETSSPHRGGPDPVAKEVSDALGASKFMSGMCLGSIPEIEGLLRSPANFYNDLLLSDILLTDVCTDLNKIYRLCLLMTGNKQFNLRLSVCCDDLFQMHLWHFVMAEHQSTLLASQTRGHSSPAASKAAQSMGDGLTEKPYFGVMIELHLFQDTTKVSINKDDDSHLGFVPNSFGVDIFTEEGQTTFSRMVHMMRGPYSNALFFKGCRVNMGSAEQWRGPSPVTTLEERLEGAVKTVQKARELLATQLSEDSTIDIESDFIWALAFDHETIEDCKNIVQSPVLGGNVQKYFNELQPCDYVFDNSTLRVMSQVQNSYDSVSGAGETVSRSLIDAGKNALMAERPEQVAQVFSYQPPGYLATDEDGQEIPEKKDLIKTRLNLQDEWKLIEHDTGHSFIVKQPGKVTGTAEDELDIGGRVQIIPPSVRATVNLYHFVLGERKGEIETVWLVEGRSVGN